MRGPINPFGGRPAHTTTGLGSVSEEEFVVVEFRFKGTFRQSQNAGGTNTLCVFSVFIGVGTDALNSGESSPGQAVRVVIAMETGPNETLVMFTHVPRYVRLSTCFDATGWRCPTTHRRRQLRRHGGRDMTPKGRDPHPQQVLRS